MEFYYFTFVAYGFYIKNKDYINKINGPTLIFQEDKTGIFIYLKDSYYVLNHINPVVSDDDYNNGYMDKNKVESIIKSKIMEPDENMKKYISSFGEIENIKMILQCYHDSNLMTS